MATATGWRCAGTAATFCEKERRLKSPVSVSVEACSCVSAMTRSSPIRAPASLARVARSSAFSSCHRLLGFPGGVNDPDGATHDRHRDTQRREATLRPIAQLRAGIEVFTVGEDLRLRPACRWTAVRRVDATPGRFPLRPDRRHPQQVGVAVVGQKQLDRCFGQDGAEGSFDDVDDLWLALGHVERIGQAALELLALDLRAP